MSCMYVLHHVKMYNLYVSRCTYANFVYNANFSKGMNSYRNCMHVLSTVEYIVNRVCSIASYVP